MNLILFVSIGEAGLSLEAEPGAKGESGTPGRFGWDGLSGNGLNY